MPEKHSSFNGDLDSVFEILFVLKLYILVKRYCDLTILVCYETTSYY
jgi:hypothetical protein